MNRDFGNGLIELLAELRTARAKGDKLAVEAAGRSLDEHVGSMEQLFRFLDELRRQVRPSSTVEQIIEWVERESRRPSRWSIATWGMMSQDFEFEALRQWLAQSSKTGGYRFTNQVDWNESDPTYHTNTEAIADAHKTGADHEIEDLGALNPDKLYKLLRKHGCTVRFMSRRKPFLGKVHRVDWQRYLQSRIEDNTRFMKAVEEEAAKLVKDEPSTRTE